MKENDIVRNENLIEYIFKYGDNINEPHMKN